MKKLLFIGLVALAGFTASAQTAARSYKFLPSFIGSLSLTNVAGITNQASPGATATNYTGVAYTNNLGTYIKLTNSTVRLLQDVPLWSLRDGSGAWNHGVTNNLLNYVQSYATLAITWYSGSGQNTALQMQFAPVYGDKEDTTAGNRWTIGITPTASTYETVTTNVPLWRWPGATALRCRFLSSNDADASSLTSLIDLSLNGFVPVGP